MPILSIAIDIAPLLDPIDNFIFPSNILASLLSLHETQETLDRLDLDAILLQTALLVHSSAAKCTV